MEAKLISDEIRKFAKEIGPRAYVSVSVSSDAFDQKKPLHGSIYPRGICGNSAVSLNASTWGDLLSQLRSEWAKHNDEYRRATVRKMALEIIHLTAEGNCTDSALRGDKFTPEEVAEYGEEACAQANQIASNGPFEIKTISRANAA
jgi:hypothetical protein